LDTLSCVLHQLLEKFIFKNYLPNSHQVIVANSDVIMWHKHRDVPPWHGLGQDTGWSIRGATGQVNHGLPKPPGPPTSPAIMPCFPQNPNPILVRSPVRIHGLHTYTQPEKEMHTQIKQEIKPFFKMFPLPF